MTKQERYVMLKLQDKLPTRVDPDGTRTVMPYEMWLDHLKPFRASDLSAILDTLHD